MTNKQIYDALIRDGKTPEQVKQSIEEAKQTNYAPEVVFTQDWINSNDTRKLGTLLLDKHREALVRAQHNITFSGMAIAYNTQLEVQETIVLEKVINLITKGTYAR